MSQPTPYTPTTDFSQQEANNASGRSTVNTAALDAEFANIETTLDQTLANIQLIQRDDGKLGDVTVEVRCLAPDVLNVIGGFNLTGLWQASTYYNVNDICSSGEYTYVCKTAHASGLSFDEQYWVQFGFTAGSDAAQAAANAQASAANALISETAASSSAVAAAASASSAASSASSASTSASSAASSAYSASTSATNAANSASQAANSAASVGFTETSTTTFSNKTLLDAKLIRPQIGVSSTANNNFTLDASADNGTMKLARGNAGATTQDILTVDAAGKVAAPFGLLGFTFVLDSNGYIQFPSWCFGGLMIQWGGVTTEAGAALKPFATSFPTTCLKVVVSPNDTSTPLTCAATVNTNTTFSCVVRNSAGTPVATGLNYIAIGK